MHRVHLKLVPIVVAWAALLGALLFSDYWVAGVNTGWTRTVALEIRAASRDPGTQWMIVLCLTVYFVAFWLIEGRGRGVGGRSTEHSGSAPSKSEGKLEPTDVGCYGFIRNQCGHPNFWLAAFLLLVLLRYAVDYTDAVRSLQVVVLF